MTSFDWVRFEALHGLEDEIRAVFDGAGMYVDEARRNAILTSVTDRIERLKLMALSHKRADDLSQDVEADVAEDYLPHSV